METKEDKRHQSHGRSIGFYKNLQRKQEAGEVKMTEPNNLKAVTDKDFKADIAADPSRFGVAEHERNFYHVIMEARSYTPEGIRLSSSYVQKYSKQNFEEVLRSHGKFAGFVTAILHDPTKEKADMSVDDDDDDDVIDTKGLSDEQAEAAKNLMDKARELEAKEKELNDRQAELDKQAEANQASAEEQEAAEAKKRASAETQLLIDSLPIKTIAQLKEFADENNIGLTGVTTKDDIIARITESLKPKQ